MNEQPIPILTILKDGTRTILQVNPDELPDNPDELCRILADTFANLMSVYRGKTRIIKPVNLQVSENYKPEDLG